MDVANGNVTMGDKNSVRGDVVCKKGVVKLGADNIVVGDVYAKDLIKGANSKITGKFVKTP